MRISDIAAYMYMPLGQDTAHSNATMVICVMLITTLDIGHNSPLHREAGRVVSNTVLKTVATGQAKR